MWRDLSERILRPLFDYLSERVGEESSILYVLERYVHLVEWFDRKDLHARAMQDPRKAEEVYDAHLRRFLFGEGINMPFSQAKSASGESDVLTDLDTDDPLVCEVKLFDSSRGKRHLASGVHQAISYASDYGKQVAYLVIINLSGKPLSLPSDDDTKLWPPRITVAGTRRLPHRRPRPATRRERQQARQASPCHPSPATTWSIPTRPTSPTDARSMTHFGTKQANSTSNCAARQPRKAIAKS